MVAHPVHVERRLLILDEDVLGQPLVEPAAGGRIAVATGLVDGQVDVYDVVGIAFAEGMTLLGADDVVRRRYDAVEVNGVGVVTDAGERLEPGHDVLATRPSGAVRESARYSWSWIWKCWTSTIIGRR